MHHTTWSYREEGRNAGEMDIWSANIEYVREYVKSGKDIEAKNYLEQSPLACASENGQEEIVRFLIESGADIESRNDDGMTPIAWASWIGHENIVKALFSSGANIDVQDNDGKTPIIHASESGRDTVVCLLAELGANVNATGSHGRTPLMLMAKYGYNGAIRSLIDAGANIEMRDEKKNTAIMHASKNGHKDIVELLLDRGANIRSKNVWGETALALSVKFDHLHITIVLASAIISNSAFRYSDIPLSLFSSGYCRRGWIEDRLEYTKFVTELSPVYMNRAIKDPAFGSDMECELREMIDKLDKNGGQYPSPDIGIPRDILVRIVKSLRTIDYTDRLSKTSASNDANGLKDTDRKDEETSSAYDMEL